MSIKISTRVWEDRSLKSTELLLMLALADNADENTRQCFPSVDYLAAKIRKSRRNVQDTIQNLVSDGKIVVTLNAGRNGTNVYTLFPTVEGGVQILHPCNSAAENRTENRRQIAPKPSGTVRNDQEPSVEYQIPILLNTPAFTAVWEEYAQHRKEKRSKLTSVAARNALRELEAMGVSRAIVAIRHTLAKGWTGIQEPNGFKASQKNHLPDPNAVNGF